MSEYQLFLDLLQQAKNSVTVPPILKAKLATDVQIWPLFVAKALLKNKAYKQAIAEFALAWYFGAHRGLSSPTDHHSYAQNLIQH